MNLRFTVGKYKFNLELNGKYNVICGDSGTGKSLLCSIIELIERTPMLFDKFNIKMFSNRNTILNSIQNNSKSLIVFDEDYLDSDFENLWQYIKESDNYYLFITRDGHPKIPYGTDTTFIMNKVGNTFTMVKKYSFITDIVKSKFDFLLVEDLGNGYKVISDLFNNKVNKIESSGGKNNLLKLIDKSKVPLVIFDSCGIGNIFDDLLYLSDNGYCCLYNSISFEHEILKTYFFSKLERYADNFKFTNLSEEDYYVVLLNRLLKDKVYIGYDKNSDLLCNLFVNGKCYYHGRTYDIGSKYSIMLYKRLNDILDSNKRSVSGSISQLKLS